MRTSISSISPAPGMAELVVYSLETIRSRHKAMIVAALRRCRLLRSVEQDDVFRSVAILLCCIRWFLRH